MPLAKLLIEGLWFLCSIFFAPLLGSVPTSAVTPALLLLACSMMSLSHNIKWNEIEQG
jgi:xanthine/uracil/vitamin C permease (AzgA family)